MVKFPKHKSEKCINSEPTLAVTALCVSCLRPLALTSPDVPGSPPPCHNPPSRPVAIDESLQPKLKRNKQQMLLYWLGRVLEIPTKRNYSSKAWSLYFAKLPSAPICWFPPSLASEVVCASGPACAPCAGLRCPGCYNLRTKTQSRAKLPVIST